MSGPPPGALVVAVFGRHAGALDWAAERLAAAFGPLERAGEPYRFDHTDYYTPTMGAGLVKRLLLFRDPLPHDALAGAKRLTIAMERELVDSGSYPEPRPVNIDPGLLTLVKFLLATTKDQSHRVYLGGGIFAESTLRFRDGSFEPWPWTYADYREPAVIAFLNAAREWLRSRQPLEESYHVAPP